MNATTAIQKQELKALFPLVMYYRDTRQWEKTRSCYHPDASRTRIRTSWLDGTVDEWIAGHTKFADSETRKSSHLIQPIEAVINETGTKGLLISTGNVTIRMVVEGIEVDIVSWCRFVNRAMLVDGDWRLVSFEAIYDRDSVSATNGVSLPENLFEFPEGARESYKYVEWVLSRQGRKISKEQPGTDRPEIVKEVMFEAEQWLHGQEY